MAPVLDVISVVVTPFQQNCRVIMSSEVDGVRPAVVVDPGGDVNRILVVLEEQRAVCKEIWLTHSHIDHCGGVAALQEETGALLYGHRAEAHFRQRVVESAAMFGFSATGIADCPEPDTYLAGGETITFGDHQFHVLFTPGHSPGHLSFYQPDAGFVISGDTLFAGAIGRTDLPGGNGRVLLDSIKTVILSLPDVTRVMPGHGPDTSVGLERGSNPFLRSVTNA